MNKITLEYSDFNSWEIQGMFSCNENLKIEYDLSPYVKVHVSCCKEEERYIMTLKICDKDICEMQVSYDNFETHFYAFKYDVSRRLKNMQRHIDKALDVSLGENN